MIVNKAITEQDIKEVLTEEEYAALNLVKSYQQKMTGGYDGAEDEDFYSVSDFLEESFLWYQSPQGAAYWIEVCDRVRELGR